MIERESKQIILLVARKTTKRKENEDGPLKNEARFRMFFERSAEAMSLLDPQTLRYIEANEAVARLLGAPNREALRNASPTERFPERQPDGQLSIEKARALIKVALDQGSLRFEWLVRRFDGTELPLDIVTDGSPFRRTHPDFPWLSRYFHTEAGRKRNPPTQRVA